jgi:hypothetical protein
VSSIKFAYLTGAAVLGLALGMASNVIGAEDIQTMAQREFTAGFAGDTEAFNRGMSACERALGENAENVDAMVWHGAGTYFQAGQAAEQGDYDAAEELMHKGMGEMNKAVDLQPNRVSVRITRGLVLSNAARFGAPEPHSLFAAAAVDFEKVLALVGEGWQYMPAPLRAQILLGLADSCDATGQKDQARDSMKRLVAEHADTPQAKRAAEWLESN